MERMDKLLAKTVSITDKVESITNTMRELPATYSKMKETVKALNKGDLGSETGKNNN